MIAHKIEELINKYSSIYNKQQETVEEIKELYEESYDPCDWSGGNFDDAYDIGLSHGDSFAKVKMIEGFISELEDLLNTEQ